MRKPRIYFRADGNAEIGFGHIMRLISIAEYARQSFDCFFITKSIPNNILDQICEVCTNVISLPDFKYLKEEEVIVDVIKSKAGILVLDGYAFSQDYKSYISSKGIKIVSIVDTLFKDLHSDVIINHAGIKDKKLFKTKASAKIFTGPSYTMLRKTFLKGAQKIKNVEGNNNVFICFGGADPKNHTLETIRKHGSFLRKRHLNIVIGSGFKFKKELNEGLDKMKIKYVLKERLNSEEMYELMSSCWMGITSASTIAYEFLCSRGILFLVQSADNQKNIFSYLKEEKIAFDLNKLGAISEKKENLALKNQNALFDGKSIERIVKIFQSLSK